MCFLILLCIITEVLAGKHAEAVFAAADALKDLIEICVDEVLVKQGVGQIQMDMNGGTRKSAPTTVEKICASLQGLIGYQYAAVWDLSFQILSVMFDKLGGTHFACACIPFLLQCLYDPFFPFCTPPIMF